jgi:signal peptidase I
VVNAVRQSLRNHLTKEARHMEEVLHSKPRIWIAVLLALFVPPLAMLYVRRVALAWMFFLVLLALAILAVVGGMDEWVFTLASWTISLGAIIVAYRAAKITPEASVPWYSRGYSLFAFFAAFAVATTVLRAFLYEPFRIPSTAMLPTLEVGSRIIVQKYGYGHYSTYGVTFWRANLTVPLRRGDVIVFDYPRDPSQTYIKRLVGLPGDRIQYVGKDLIVNGVNTRSRKLDDYRLPDQAIYLDRYANKLDGVGFDTVEYPNRIPFASEAWQFPMKEQCSQVTNGVECIVPAGHFFMMGDSRDNSLDSRYWGFVRPDQIIGRVVATF